MTFEEIEARAIELFSKLRPIEEWPYIDEGDRNYWRKKRATNWMNLSQLRRAVWLRRLSAASQSRFTLLKNHHRLGWLSAKTLFERRDALAAKMTPTQIAEAQKLPREWKSSEQ